MLESWFTSSPTEVVSVERNAEAQERVDVLTANLALYHYDACVYCGRVRKAISALHLNIEMRDVLRDARHRRDLETGGGRTTVPCLCIADGSARTWMYESDDIIAYLTRRFGNGAAGGP